MYASDAGKRVGIRPGTLGMVHRILNDIDPQAADFFLRRLADGVDLGEESPIRTLRERMTSAKMARRKMDEIEETALIFKAWNAYRSNRELKLLKFDRSTSKFPIPV